MKPARKTRFVNALGRALFCLAHFGGFSAACLAAPSPNSRYVGPETCALCHKDIAATQTKTAMANTWQGALTSWLPRDFAAKAIEGPDPAVISEIRSSDDQFRYVATLPGHSEVTLPIEAMVGGRRHGLGFLFRVPQLNGIPLDRSALIQARYSWSFAQNKFVLAPGCPVEKPHSYETAFGIVLSPAFERRCLECHGQPNTLGAGKNGGVHCESCHGPGSQHLVAVGKGNPGQGIINPRKLNAEDSIGICAQCHIGLTKFSDPSPDDLLIANQVLALKNSECFIQSGKAISCTTCHDPHRNAEESRTTSVSACMGCHSERLKEHAAICPVNARDSCLGCHMPSAEIGPFHLVDHLIRVHPEQGITAGKKNESLRSQVPLKREFLNLIVTSSREAAQSASERLAAGESFYKIARESSQATGLVGGYLGATPLNELDPVLEAVAQELSYGQTSAVIGSGDRWSILQRLPRDFKWNAEQLQRQAETLIQQGDRQAAIQKSRQALLVYPHFLRALLSLGKSLAETGNPGQAVDLLRLATAIYPADADAMLNLGVALSKLGRTTEAIGAYRRTIELDPDITFAYRYLGNALTSNENLQEAIDVFRQGLQVDPLSAQLYYGLSLALKRKGDLPASKRAMDLATQINPELKIESTSARSF